MNGMKAVAQLALYLWALTCALFSIWMALAAFYALLIGSPRFERHKLLAIAGIEVFASIVSFLAARHGYRKANALKALG
jgi:hypothetical protein